jgi:hypothetical protein
MNFNDGGPMKMAMRYMSDELCMLWFVKDASAE